MKKALTALPLLLVFIWTPAESYADSRLPSEVVREFVRQLPNGIQLQVNKSSENIHKCQIRKKFDESLPLEYRGRGLGEVVKVELNLQLYIVERLIGTSWRGADIVSVLSRGEKTWLRAGPDWDTGWIEITDLDPMTPLEFPLRTCLARVERTDLLQNERLAEGDLLFLAPIRGNKDVSPLILRPAVSKLSREPLGIENIMAIVLSEFGGRKELSVEALLRLRGSGLPASSQSILRRATHILGGSFPSSESEYLPDFQSPINSDVEISAQLSADSLPQPEQYLPDPLCSPDYCKTACDQMGRIYAPRARVQEKAYGFDWEWVGLSNAKISNSTSRTSCCGCFQLKGKPTTTFILENPHVAVMDENSNAARLVLDSYGPQVFLPLGEGSDLSGSAVTAFISANEGVAEFGRRIYPWMPRYLENIAIVQVGEPPYSCAAKRIPKKLYLPATCPRVGNFVAKGTCHDLVTHELAHEMMGSLSSLATDGRCDTVSPRMVNEAAADFFSLTLRLDGEPRISEFARYCQNDFKDLANPADPGHEGQNALVRALLREERTFIGRLLSVAAMYNSYRRSPLEKLTAKKFLAEMFDFADQRADIPQDKLCSLCQAISSHSAIEVDYCTNACQPANEPIEVSSFEKSLLERTIKLSQEVSQWRGLSSSLEEESGAPFLLGMTPPRKVVALNSRGEANVFGPETLAPGVSISPRGEVQGWTASGQQVNTKLETLDDRKSKFSTRLGRPWESLPLANLPKNVRPVLQEFPRVEIMEHDSVGMAVAFWDSLTVERLSWGFEIDPSSLQVRRNIMGRAVVSVVDRVSKVRKEFSITGHRMEEGRFGLTFRMTDTPGVEFQNSDGDKVEIDFDQSVCLAPPFFEVAGEILLTLTCDGEISSIDLGAWPPEIQWTFNAPGVVPPGRDGTPIQRADFDDDGRIEWVVGPFRFDELDKRTVDRFYVLSEGKTDSERPREFGQVTVEEPTVGVPTIIDRKGDGCAELMTTTAKRTDYWTLGVCSNQ